MSSVKIIIQTTKGIIRDQQVRRAAMFILVLGAMVMLAAGVTFLNAWLLNNRWLFLLYWLVCMWLTLTSILLAIFDLLTVRLLLRRERRRLREESFGKQGGQDGHDGGEKEDEKETEED
ncbi:MAG TPA: hypothetical protein VG733_09710 [Chthoniobacteraceae bacterium]|nr:hypothetical protein [Chthoniobacteraceae bacterium]